MPHAKPGKRKKTPKRVLALPELAAGIRRVTSRSRGRTADPSALGDSLRIGFGVDGQTWIRVGFTGNCRSPPEEWFHQKRNPTATRNVLPPVALLPVSSTPKGRGKLLVEFARPKAALRT